MRHPAVKKIFKWIIEHVRLHAGYVKEKEESLSDDSEDMSLPERIDDFKERGEVGIKFKFRF